MQAPIPTYQLKITLQDTSPPIWRRILIGANTRLDIFHLILQEVMGWSNSHLHQFVTRGGTFGSHDPEFGGDRQYLEYEDETRYRLSQVLVREKDALVYEYDFGDGWQHKIILEKILPEDKTVQLPICVKGKRNGPPEDCGGVGGYENLIEVMHDPKHPEHEEMVEWLGGEFDPEHFSLDEINAALSPFHRQRTKKKTSAS